MSCFALWIFSLLAFGCIGFTEMNEGKHSLYYQFIMHSQPSKNNLFYCTAETLLDGKQLNSYNSSTDETKTPKPNWLKNIPESDWNGGFDELSEDHLELNNFFHQMKDLEHNESRGHVLQWLHGCESENGSVSNVKCIDKYACDGEDLIGFNHSSKKWSAALNQAKEMEKKWNTEHDQNAIRRCGRCVNWLKTYLSYTNIEKQNISVFTMKSKRNPSKLILTCLATGFHQKDVKMSLRKFNTSLPDHLITSSGVRPNDDGTYQLRKSVDISDDDPADYDCYVSHSSLTESVIKQWEGPGGVNVTLIMSLVLLVLVFLALLLVVYILKKKGKICKGRGSGSDPVRNGNVSYTLAHTGNGGITTEMNGTSRVHATTC